MSTQATERRGSGLGAFDLLLVVGVLVLAGLIGLWIFHVVVSLLLWVVKVAVVVVVGGVIVRLFMRRR